ncbi:putative protein kinase RLK-Pelle-RLCK-VIIa-1 family [Medicago truncatula]|uniref:Protein kinase domain-containing protein n=1 Tax=Medicago truncatula TaxID=3880 RepID=A0A396H021_MEDTR|nr:putative protein kinase RLK-Pelle-RLCK-VIIa-1 family [Medicago truncatula]
MGRSLASKVTIILKDYVDGERINCHKCSLFLLLVFFVFFVLLNLPPGKKPLDWNTRMRVVAVVAKGLEYLHDKMKPPVIYRDLKCSNILLGYDYHPKLFDFGGKSRFNR